MAIRLNAFVILFSLGLCMIVVGLLPSSAQPLPSLTSSYLTHPILTVVNSTGQPVWGAQVAVWTLNPASHLASIALANPSADLVEDQNFTADDLLIGPTINSTVAIGPMDGNLVLTNTYTDRGGIARFNITAGIYLVNVDAQTGYFNVITHLRTGWTETLKLKPSKNPNPEPDGPYASGTIVGITLGGSSANNSGNIRPVLLLLGTLLVPAALILGIVTRRKRVVPPRPISGSK